MNQKWFERTLIILGIIALCVLLYLGFTAGKVSAATVCQIGNGCTGTSTAPAYGKVLVGGQNGEYELVSTSTFGSAGAGTVTSVGLTSPGSTLTVGSTPVTTNGTITADINLASGNQWTASTTFTKVVNLANASSSLNSLGTVWIPSITSALHLADSTGKITAYTGTSCTNQFVRSLNGAGVATCNTVSLTSDVTGTLPLANGGTNASLSGASGIAAMNSGNSALSIPSASYTLTAALLTAPNASTTDITASNELVIPNGSSKGATVAGQLELDTTNDQLKVGDGSATAIFDQRRFLTFTYSTSTAYTGTTTLALGTAPAALTLQNVQCFTDTGTLDVQFQYGATPTLSAWLQASTTIGTFSWTTNNTPAAGNTLKVAVGTPVSSPTTISCTATAVVSGT